MLQHSSCLLCIASSCCFSFLLQCNVMSLHLPRTADSEVATQSREQPLGILLQLACINMHAS